MRKSGRALGGSLDNTIVIGKTATLNGLRYRDEFVRHKVLDLIGDLALIGHPLVGHVIAERAGHAMHAALVARIMSDPSLYEIITFDQLASRVAQTLMSEGLLS